MGDIKVASRYAKSLLKIAIEEKALEDLYADMLLVNKVCAQNRELVLLLESPIVKSDKKKAILDNIFGKELSTIASTFIALIVRKKRAGILGEIAESFINVYKKHKNIKTAQVTSAIPLSNKQREDIITLLDATNKASEIILNEVVDDQIIGGVILKVGDKQVDESIRRKLSNLEMEFDQNPYIKEY